MPGSSASEGTGSTSLCEKAAMLGPSCHRPKLLRAVMAFNCYVEVTAYVSHRSVELLSRSEITSREGTGIFILPRDTAWLILSRNPV